MPTSFPLENPPSKPSFFKLVVGYIQNEISDLIPSVCLLEVELGVAFAADINPI
jgi:hypothetical protein